MVDRPLKLTVSLITYNHARYIAQAIEGVLMQQTGFDFELLIGEDNSTDGTRDLVKAYQAKHPERIRLLLNDRKNVSFANGKPTGNWNFANNVRHARGQYVALLDGDDYWTSPHKLQKQVDYLDTNPDCALCFHNVEILDEAADPPLHPQYTKRMRPKYDMKDLLKGNFMHTCSVVFRSGLFEDFPPWFFRCPLGDWPLHVLNVQHGRIGYLNEVMAVYRKHVGGVLSAQPRLDILAITLQTALELRASLRPNEQLRMDARIAQWQAELYGARGDHRASARVVAEYYRKYVFRTHTEPWRVLRFALKAKFRAARQYLSAKLSRPLP